MRAARRVALVGTGYFAPFHARAWQRLDGAAPSDLVAPDRAAGDAFAHEHLPGAAVRASIGALPVRPDIVDLVTPPESHAALVHECIEADVPLVICQKPFCRTLDEAESLVDAVDASATTLVVHENFRFQPWYREIKRLLDEGALGTLYALRFDLRPGDGQGDDAYLARQPYFREQTEFLIRETGVHLIDVFRYLVGEVHGLFAHLARLNPVIRGEDAGIVLFDFAHGVRATFDGNRLVDHAAANPRLVMGEMRLEGSEATLALSGDGRLQRRAHGAVDWTEHRYRFEDREFGGDCVHRCCAHVLAHLVHGAPLENAAHDYLVNRRLEALVYRSHRERRWLDARAAHAPSAVAR